MFSCHFSQVTLIEHGELELSPGFTERLLQGIGRVQQRKEEGKRAALKQQQLAQPRHASKKKVTKEERLAQEVLRMYKSWDSMRGVEMTHEGFFPPELEYLKRKQKRPAVERRIKETGRFVLAL